MKEIITGILALIVIGIGTLGLNSCKPKYKEPSSSAGEIDASRFVMIGGSHTAGYMDDGLYYEGQENSIANLISLKLQVVGSGAFYQPMMSVNSVGVNASGMAHLKLGYKTDCLGVTSLSPVRIAASGDVAALSSNIYNASQPFGNFGIPGMTVTAVNVSSYGSANSFFGRMNSSSSATVLADATVSDPTCFAVFLGIEDLLPFVQKGASNGSMTSVANFSLAYENIVSTLTANGAKGIVSLIPDITEMPYFTTVPWNGLNLTPDKVTSLNNIYNPIGISFQEGANGFMIEDPGAGAFNVRHMEPGELVLLSTPLDSVKCNLMGSAFPFRDEFVLTLDELTAIRARIAEYNAVITNIATAHNLAIARTNDLVNTLQKGMVYNGITLSAKFVSGGAYSLDGIHFNAKGNAIIANEFIRALNVKYKAQIPSLNAVNYSSTIFP
ncbi:lipase [Fluviicola taffensis]|uniref:Lipolytic protein G-D-S-L family n=1 Tax=Fluviicola taffensis (strain DSM 16823 / NCIMB 13979 / RW262) TaxID=755732 RepID=F2ICT1_FLUTR|nr:lipase [Fluviicola taffensis]AEA43305.1 lipolytic protein G-D-S-L family [Fluviicola taffensis DSM 16823]